MSQYNNKNSLGQTMPHLLKPVFTGSQHTFFLVDHKLYVWGYSSYGETGFHPRSTRLNTLVPIELAANEHIVAVALGHEFSTVATSTGKVFLCGSDTFESSALSSFTQIHEPTQATERVVNLFAGAHHFFALTVDKELWAHGNNRCGQCGITIGDEIISNFRIVPLAPGEDVASIAAGARHSILLTTHGRVFACGDNTTNACGFGAHAQGYIDQFTLVNIPGLAPDQKIISVSAGSTHSLLLASDHSVYAAGIGSENQYGTTANFECFTRIPQLELKRDEKIILIEAGYQHSSLLTSFGRLLQAGFYQISSLEPGAHDRFGRLPPLFTERSLGHLNLFDGERIIDVISNSFRSDRTFILSNLGRLFVMGNNIYTACAIIDRASDFITKFSFVGYLGVPSFASSRYYATEELIPFYEQIRTLCREFIRQFSEQNRAAIVETSEQLSKLFSGLNYANQAEDFWPKHAHLQWLLAFMLCTYQQQEYRPKQVVPEILLSSCSRLVEETHVPLKKIWDYLQQECYLSIEAYQQSGSLPELGRFSMAFKRFLPSTPLDLRVARPGMKVELHPKLILDSASAAPVVSIIPFDTLANELINKVFSFATPTDAAALALTSQRRANLVFGPNSPLGYFKYSRLPQTLRLPPQTPRCILGVRHLLKIIEIIKQYIFPHEHKKIDFLMKQALAQQISTYYFYDFLYRITLHPLLNIERPMPIPLSEIVIPGIMGVT